jgi:PiT family inorganic phosphate transporter
MGVGLRRGRGAVRWRTVGEMALAWGVTLPTAGALAIAAFSVMR